jgi:ABC-type cobalamin transport system permease subunit
MTMGSIAESRKAGWSTRIANALCVLVILAALAINGADLWGYFSNPSRNPIGAEMAGVLYSSRSSFLLLTGGTSMLCGLGLIAPVWTKMPRTRILIRAIVALVVVVGMAYLASTVER